MNLNYFSEQDIDKIEQALDVKFTSKDRESLINGGYTSLIDEISDGKCKRPGKIHLDRDPGTREVRVNFYFKKETLFIPDILFGRKLSKDDKQRIKDGQLLRFNYKGNNIYLQLDKELNSVIVKGDRELNIPDVIGNYHDFPGYHLTPEDKKIVVNGGILPPKVMKGSQGFFLANFGMTKDRTGYSFSEYQSIPSGSVADYIERYNSVDRGNDIDTSLSENKDSELVKPELDISQKVSRNFDDEFYEALSGRDFVKLNELAKSGYKPADLQISKIDSMQGLSDTDRTAIKTIFNIEVREGKENSGIIKKNMTKGNIAYNPENEVKTSHGKKERIGNIMCQLFHDA